jgi:dipeptidyl aminopeptidase/acylaminoacyl peptidase
MSRHLVQRSVLRRIAFPIALLALGAGLAGAQENSQVAADRELLATESYVRPPEVVERIVAAPRHLNVQLENPNPARTSFLREVDDGMPTLERYGKPHTYFAGLQVDTKANRARSLTTRSVAGLEVIDARSGERRTIETPKGARISGAVWSPDGAQIAYLVHTDDASHVWVADVKSGKSRQVTRTPLLATLVTSVAWTADSRNVVTVLLPTPRMTRPAEPVFATGPTVRWNEGKTNKTRTFASLLDTPYDKELMAYYITGQLALVDVRSRAERKVGEPAMIMAADVSPKGDYVRVTRMVEPFAYTVQYRSFGQVEELWNAGGDVVAVLNTQPLRDGTDNDDDDAPGGDRQSADTSRRDFAWHPTSGALLFLKQDPAPPRDSSASQGQDQASGGRAQNSRRRDHLYQWMPPFEPNGATVLLESNNRMSNVLFSDDASMLFAVESGGGFTTQFAVKLSEPTKRYTIYRVRGNASGRGFGGGGGDSDSSTFYNNPGRLVTKRAAVDGNVAMTSDDGRFAYLSGTKYFPNWQENAPRGFVDRVEIATGDKTRIFESGGDVFEEAQVALDDDFNTFIITRESATMVPDYYLRTAGGAVTKLTSNTDFAPEVTQAQRRRLQVTRPDGYKLWVDITLPRDWREGTRMPALFWFYPREYTSQSEYDRTKRTENANQFPRVAPRSIETMVTQGYAVVQPDLPIIGESGRMNDNYVPDLRNTLSAVIDELDRQGYIDRQRLGLGGHSYGAFSTVNAMVNTPFFKAGIAGDGNYNRTLTPNGFQSERRDLWAGRETYLSMSPFLYADRLTGALLMYHSIEDQNVGTDPIHSIKLMHVLQGLGKTASLYMYPYEDHGPQIRETVLDQWARWTAWLDLYVKNAELGSKTDKIAIQP